MFSEALILDCRSEKRGEREREGEEHPAKAEGSLEDDRFDVSHWLCTQNIAMDLTGKLFKAFVRLSSTMARDNFFSSFL